MVLARLIERAARPIDAASLAVYRIALGVALFVAAVRFFVHGWIAADWMVPRYFFHYWGFGWVSPLGGRGMYAVYVALAVTALGIALGLAYRACALIYAFAFTYAHLCDKTNYLNHYYLVSLIAFLLVLLPLDRELSLRVWRCPDERARLQAWMLWLLRFQIGVVYVFGGLGKIGRDWLLHAEPLRIWLMADAELPVLRHLANRPWFAFAFSWSGLLFDLSVVPLLLWRRSRALAYVAVIVFHVTTAVLFAIGMFPWIMIVSATLFFDPSWPRRWLRPAPTLVAGPTLSRAGLAAIAVHALIQVAMPLRGLAYPGDTLWSEEGFRFAWKVMLIEKSGTLELHVVDGNGHRSDVSPRQYLTAFQSKMASTQPDMILELAHIVADDYARRGRGPVRVYADAQVSWNGRFRAPLVDPDVDLAQAQDSLAHLSWILPAPTTPSQF